MTGSPSAPASCIICAPPNDLWGGRRPFPRRRFAPILRHGQSIPSGKLGERSQRHFEPAPVQTLDPQLAASLGLEAGEVGGFASAGASATVAALSRLIEEGGPK